MIAANSRLRIAFTNLSVTSYALISGFRSYVSTWGDGTRMRVSPGYSFSLPPLKKNVTCAYFSVSAMRSCGKPLAEIYSPKLLFMLSGGNAQGALIASEYSVRSEERRVGKEC